MFTQRVCVTDNIQKTARHVYSNVIGTFPKYCKDLASEPEAAKSTKI